MEEFCGSKFWDYDLSWNTTDPYLTPCFEESAVALFPIAFLVLFGFVDILNVRRSKFRTKSLLSTFNIFHAIKLLLTIILIAIYITQLIRLNTELGSSVEFFTVDNLTPALQLTGYVLILILTILTHYFGISSSGVQFLFWLASAVSQAVLFRTAVVKFDGDEKTKLQIIYLTRLIAFPIIAIRLILECFNEDLLLGSSNEKIRLGKPSPDKTSTFISKVLFLWYDKLAWTGYRRPLTSDDLWDLNPDDRSQTQTTQFSKLWSEEQEKTKRKPIPKSGKQSVPGILTPIFKLYGYTFLFGSTLKLIADLLVFVQPEMIRSLVAHITSSVEPAWKGYFFTAVIVISVVIQSILNAASMKRANLIGMRMRTALSNAVFRKALVVSNASKKESSVGEVVNLMSIDAQKFCDLLPMINMSIGSPLQIIISVYLLYNNLGPSIFAGVAILLLILPFNGVVLSFTRRYQMEQMKLKDERIKLTSEVMSGIKVLKLYAWEKSYQEQIEEIRGKEIVLLRKIALATTIVFFVFTSAPVMVAVATFATYVLSDENNVLNAEKTFVSISLFNIIRLPMVLFPMTLSLVVQAMVSVNRLNKYLNTEELDKTAVSHDDKYEEPVLIEKGTFSWTDESTTLKDINFRVKTGELVAVVGTIGSGKTSLLCSLLGDLKKHEGIVNTKGSMAYVSQGAWIQNATLRDNITFGDKLVQAKYDRVLEACSLKQDLEILTAGDQTEIGEKGINLSGGQKQRVALARAAYKESSIYLFDDPLSAVDSHVGKHIFENLIGPNGVLRQTTRVLVTHGVSFLPHVDRIVVMKNGQISESGTYKELLMKQGEFAEFLLTHLGVENDEEIDPDTLSLIQDLEAVVGADEVRRRSSGESIIKALKRLSSVVEKKETVKVPETIADPTEKLIQDETVAEGNSNLKIYVDYFKSAGIFVTILAIVMNMASNGLIAYSNIWLSNWSTEATFEEIATGTTSKSTTNYYLTGYGSIGGAQAVASFLGSGAIAVLALAATKALHSAALARVIKAPMSYFDTTLLGRLINRFAKDVDLIDNLIPGNLRAVIQMLFNVISTFVVISYTTPIFIAFIIPMAIVYFFVQRFYIATSRQLKRLESVSRSPIYSHFGETVSGSTTIRAFQLEDEFVAESERRIDLNQMCFFPFIASNMWMSLRLEFLGAIIILFTCLFTLLAEDLDPGNAGLAISYALQVTSLLNFLARNMSDLETNIVSVERVSELTETPQEAEWEKADSKLDPSWPQNGEVLFKNYATRYREGLDLVIKGITCTIKPGEKIGVVGRTGAGKSSLTLALFRLIEPVSGGILIDGVDITSLGLHELRKRITIIPQDPVLFSGTVRRNLDPFNQYSDEQVWKCLELCHLKPYISTLPEGLFHKVEEDGQNFSVGQRQLICLGRALLRKTKILVLDEATAAVDLETDDLIQATIRKEFAECSIITIAHRLNTIMDSNRVLVLDKGEIKEFDSPSNLLEDSTSVFWSMARDAKLVN